jgi:hypothetical protein
MKMEKLTHTPGPWHRNIKPATKYSTVWSGRNKHVAAVTVSGLSPEEVEANISLIAAAPELLAALKALMPVLDKAQETDNVFGKMHNDAMDAEQAARAAIAKATAEQEA